MADNREKSRIEELLEKIIDDMEKEKSSIEKNGYDYGDVREYMKYNDKINRKSNGIAYMKNLLLYFEDLEKERENGEEEKYNIMFMEFLLRNLPPKMSEKFSECLSADNRNINKEKREKLEEKKKDLIKSFTEKNAKNKAKYVYHTKDNTPLFIVNIKNKINTAQKNSKQKAKNKEIYGEIIDWLEHNFVSRYSYKINPKTYFYTDRQKGTRKYNPENLADYEAFEKAMFDKRITDEIEKCQELLEHANLSLEIKQNIKDYQDLKKSNMLIEQLIGCLRGLGLGDEYKNFHNEIPKITKELQSIMKKNIEEIKKLKASINISKLYDSKKEEIEKSKTTDLKWQKAEEEAKNVSPDHETIVANRKWEENYIYNFLERKKGRKLTEDEKSYESKTEAIIALNYYLKRLDDDMRKYFTAYYQQELLEFITKDCQITDEMEIEAFIQYSMLTPKERYIKEMVKNKKLPADTRVEDLTRENLEKFDKNKDKYLGDERTKKVQELKNRINTVSNTSFTSIYKIEDVEKMLEQMRLNEFNYGENEGKFVR